jgi:ferredoxin--NADP+ reductase
VAKTCQPGQFVIVMPDERGERIPLTIADWDRKQGTVTAVFLVVGTSTQKLSLLKAGDELPVFVGPLGKPSEVKEYGTVLLAGGCFGIAAIYPIARALKEKGNRVLVLLDVKANYLLYWEDKLRKVSDEFFVSARDNSVDCQSYIPRKLEALIKEKKGIVRIHAIGCTYLMFSCAQASRPFGVKTMVSLNPIMVDGTGMCGGCRVEVDGRMLFACVDGPEFDAHKVNFRELSDRLTAYRQQEKLSEERHQCRLPKAAAELTR